MAIETIYVRPKASEEIKMMLQLILYRRWTGKTSYVHLAPEHVFTIKHLRGPE